MKNGTNLFFLVVVGGAAWWAWNEFQKQKQHQAELLRLARERTQTPPEELTTIDPLSLPKRRDYYGGEIIYF